ncbi:addiction module protein [Kaistella sp. DKR-2]|uniref:addiction module protein n=1 Tax=Kaistella soli TaxID=2849654 RepID=UPI001C2621BF|nr:addiction module protein [Kaistella soli]MBU8882709.1 addiction module protein [Kaistella soli]
MNITVEQLTEKLKTLPEHFLERVWGYIDALAEEKDHTEISDLQKTVVAERLNEYRKNPDSGIEIDDVFKEIEKNFE